MSAPEPYITVADLVSSVGERQLLNLLDHHLEASPDADLSLDNPAAVAALHKAVAAAQGLAEAHLGRRFTPAQLEAAGKSEAVRACVVDVAVYRLAPSALPQTEEMERRHRQALKDLDALGKGLLSAGTADPSPPPTHADLVAAPGLSDHW